MKFSIKDFFSKCDRNRRKLWIWSRLLKKSFMENFIFVQWHLRPDLHKVLLLQENLGPMFFIGIWNASKNVINASLFLSWRISFITFALQIYGLISKWWGLPSWKSSWSPFLSIVASLLRTFSYDWRFS